MDNVPRALAQETFHAYKDEIIAAVEQGARVTCISQRGLEAGQLLGRHRRWLALAQEQQQTLLARDLEAMVNNLESNIDGPIQVFHIHQMQAGDITLYYLVEKLKAGEFVGCLRIAGPSNAERLT